MTKERLRELTELVKVQKIWIQGLSIEAWAELVAEIEHLEEICHEQEADIRGYFIIRDTANHEIAQLRNTLKQLDNFIAESDLNHETETWLRRVIRKALKNGGK